MRLVFLSRLKQAKSPIANHKRSEIAFNARRPFRSSTRNERCTDEHQLRDSNRSATNARAYEDQFLCSGGRYDCQRTLVIRIAAITLAGSASPKPHPSKPHPCNMPQAKTEVALQFSECCAAEVALQHWLFCSADVILAKSCAAASENCTATLEKLHCRKVALSCRFPADFKPPRLGTHV